MTLNRRIMIVTGASIRIGEDVSTIRQSRCGELSERICLRVSRSRGHSRVGELYVVE